MMRFPGWQDFGSKQQIAFAAAFLLFVLAVLAASPAWHSAAKAEPMIGRFLEGYDNYVFQGQPACFTLAYENHSPPTGLIERLLVVANSRVLFSHEIALDSEGLIERCIPSSALAEGDNLVEILFGADRLFFHVDKSAALPAAAQPSSIEVVSLSGRTAVVRVTNNSPKGGTYPLDIYVGSQLKLSILSTSLPRKSADVLVELPLEPGANNVRFSYLDAGLEAQAQFPSPVNADPLLGTALLLLFSCAALFWLLSRYEAVEAVAILFMALLPALIAVPWLANLAGIPLGFHTSLAALAAAALALCCATCKRKRLTPRKSLSGEELLLLACMGAVAVALATIPLTLPSHYTNWNVFYERYSESVVNSNAIPLEDSLGYLGRGFTFTQGYFLFNSSLAFLTGLSGTALFALICALTNLLFLFSVLYFSRQLGFGTQKGFLLFLLLASSLFVFVNLLVSPKHTLALSLMLLALGLMERPKCRPEIAGCIAGVAAFTQISFLAFFPVSYFVVSRTFRRKKLLIAFAVSAIVFLAMFAPTLAHFGMPYEVAAEEWGYLITHKPLDLFADLGGIVSLIFLAVLAKAFIDFPKSQHYELKLLCSAIALMLFEVIVSYRINLVAHLALSLLLFSAFAQQLKERYFQLLILVLVLLSISTNAVILALSVTSPEELSPLSFLASHSQPNERILSDPLYSHLETYVAQRPVLADLYVEYADEQKLSDSYAFLTAPNEALLERYGISYVLAPRKELLEAARTPVILQKEPEFEFMDKVYVNPQFSIHRSR